MATQIIKSVGATGRDYATWQLACAAIPLDLIAADENWIFEFYNDAEFDFQVNAAYLSSGTGTPRTIIADATRTVTFRAKAGHGFADHANKLTNPLRYDQSKGVGVVVGQGGGSSGLTNDIPYCKIEGMQIRGAVGTTHLIWCTATESGIKNCIIKSTDAQWAVKLHGGASVVNSAIQIVGATQWGAIAFSGPASVIGCTLFGESNQHVFFNNYGGGTGITIRDCVATGFSSFLRDYNASTGGAMWSGGTYSNNASDTTIPIGTSNLENLTSANQFVNIASAATLDLRPKAGNSLQAGVTDAALGGIDILKQTRAGTPTIGAMEYVAGGGGASVVVDGVTLTGAGSMTPGTVDVGGWVTVDGVTLSGAGSVAGGSVSTGASASFTSSPMKNNATSSMANTAVLWEWRQGTGIGVVPTSVTYGSGTTTAGGVLVATGLPAGEGDLLAATADYANVFFERGTAA